MKARYQVVTVTAPARLHMGFIDMSGALGRHFGSMGVGLNEIATRLTVSAAAQRRVEGPGAARAARVAEKLCSLWAVPDGVHIDIETAIPEHIGLGSGTQLALALGVALSRFYGLGHSARDIAALTDRGLRSGIGIGVFEQGGLVVDGGRGPNTQTPPVLSRLPIPAGWRFILVFDRRGQGLHGEQEVGAFERLPPFPRAMSERLSYLLLMQALPALAEGDLTRFGEVVTQLQRAVGEHFAPAQGGVFTSPEVADAMDWLQGQGAVAIGQTSWGPTGFCAVDSEAQGRRLLAQIEALSSSPHLDFTLASASASGAVVECR